MIDRKQFNDVFEYFDKEVIVEIIDIFVSEYDDRFRKLRANVTDKDFKNLQFNAHSLKGVIANFMDPVTIEQSKRLDEMAKKEIVAGLEKALEDLELNSALLLKELKIIKKEFI
ncbi:MAG: Hpt domain-containing protein [Bacteroidetes bacterium]|nr:Hpt domain-containing protein [Bacteroidota bacterium]